MSKAPATAAVAARFGSGSGLGLLDLEKVGSRTEFRRRQAASPLKWLTPRTAGPVAWAVSSHYGGGMVAGDRMDLRLSLGPGAQLLASTQAPAKVFGGEPGVTQKVQALLGERAVLAWLPDPLVCFKDAVFAQEQSVEMGPGASLLWAETLGSGRSLRGERWAFQRYRSRLRVKREGRLILSETLSLAADKQPLARHLGRYDAIASVFICGPAFAEGAAGLLQAVAAAPLALHQGVIESAGAWGQDGAVLRLAAESAESLQTSLRQRIAFISAWLGDDPWQRRML